VRGDAATGEALKLLFAVCWLTNTPTVPADRANPKTASERRTFKEDIFSPNVRETLVVRSSSLEDIFFKKLSPLN
jgi:hypothetical protein